MTLCETATVRKLARTRAEQVAAYRFFHNDSVQVSEIVATAGAATDAAAAGRHVLLIEDTTEINYQSKAGRKRDLGRVGNGKDVGLFCHPVLAVDGDDGTVLGLAGVHLWRRNTAKRPDYQSHAIETKESYRWIEAIDDARGRLGSAAMITVVADREADIYELFARLPDARTHLVVRAAHDRALSEPHGRLIRKLEEQPAAGQIDFTLPARPGRSGREVRLAVRFTALTLRQPRRGANPDDPRGVTLYAVEVRESHPPAGEKPIIWRLLTTHRVATLDDAIAVVAMYRRRWTIEQLFRTLKSQALDIEASFLEDGAALERLAATALVAAVQVMQLVHARGSEGQNLPAARVFTPCQLDTLRALTKRLEGKTAKQKNPHPADSLAWAAWHIEIGRAHV